MTALFKSIVLLCGLCSMVMGKENKLAFNWYTFSGKEGENETLADYTQLKIETYEENGIRIRYLEGMFEYKVQVNETDPFTVKFTLEGFKTGFRYFSVKDLSGTLPICDFFTDIFRTFLLPMMESHIDFEIGESPCPILAKEYNLLPPKNLDELQASSDLVPGLHRIDVTILKDDVRVGGFKGMFRAIQF